MEGHGHGPKTFSLETDAKGKVVVHVVRLKEALPAPPFKGPAGQTVSVPPPVIAAAESVVDTRAQRKGTVMVVVYNGYYWTDRKACRMIPTGRGLHGQTMPLPPISTILRSAMRKKRT